MSFKDIETLWTNLDLSQNKHAEVFFNALRENRKEADNRYRNSYYSILLLAGIFYLLASGDVQEVSVFSIKLSQVDVLRWVIPALIGFFIYTGTAAFFVENYLRQATYSYIKRYLPEVYKMDLEALSDHPSFMNAERLFSRAGGAHGSIASNFGGVIAVALLTVNYGILISTLVSNLGVWKTAPLVLTVPSVVIAMLFALRAAAMTVFVMKDGVNS